MTIRAYRIVKSKHQHTAFNGYGCQFTSGRWHNKMSLVVYCSESPALAALESFVHLQQDGKHIKFVSFEVLIPEILAIDVEDICTFPKRWRKHPPGAGTKKIGSDWVKSMKSAVLSVPSTIIPANRNYLLNPQHPDIGKISIGAPVPFSFDSRMWK
jgi:RES domain-containing protein